MPILFAFWGCTTTTRYDLKSETVSSMHEIWSILFRSTSLNNKPLQLFRYLWMDLSFRKTESAFDNGNWTWIMVTDVSGEHGQWTHVNSKNWEKRSSGFLRKFQFNLKVRNRRFKVRTHFNDFLSEALNLIFNFMVIHFAPP